MTIVLYGQDKLYFVEALPTVNFKRLDEGGQELVDFIEGLGEFPLFVMEYWTGWFDEWGGAHSSDMEIPSKYTCLFDCVL